MGDKAWKAFERRLARAVGTERLPVGGKRHEPDFVADGVFYQAKLTKAVPAWQIEALDGVRAYAARVGATGVLVVKRPGDLTEDAIVMLHWGDWIALLPTKEAA